MENETMPPPSNGMSPPNEIPPAASSDDLMKVLVRQHRIINNLKDQIANLMLGLAENQASMEETREELNQARSDLDRLHAGSRVPQDPSPIAL